MYRPEEIDAVIARSIAALDFKNEPQNLYAPLEYMISIGGKRIRPRLCLTTFTLFSDKVDRKILDPAMALEIFHSFTLIHDDIMDKADTRRGQKTVHVKWGDNCAILSGDVMSIISYQYLAGCAPATLPAALELFSKTAAQVCEGQQYDMDFEDMPVITMEDYYSMIGLKTAVLIACSAKMGAMIAGAPEEVCNALYEYGYQLGMAFQITDYDLDTYGYNSLFGKTIGGDIANNKKTWLLVECMKLCADTSSAELRRLLAMGADSSREKFEGMVALYNSLGIKERAMRKIAEFHSNAMAAIDGIGLNADQKEILTDFAEKLIYRES